MSKMFDASPDALPARQVNDGPTIVNLAEHVSCVCLAITEPAPWLKQFAKYSLGQVRSKREDLLDGARGVPLSGDPGYRTNHHLGSLIGEAIRAGQQIEDELPGRCELVGRGPNGLALSFQ
ncbi:MAG: hypothetical protein JO100_17630 [Pseudonocardia sp.]|nr:hypothetical protein [Pseudonocardia sp.]